MRRGPVHYWRGLTLGTAILLVAAACGQEGPGETEGDSTSEEPIKIAYVAALSGFAAIADVPALEGVEYQVDVLNKEGGIDGHPIELVVRDMESDPAVASRVTQEVVDEGAAVVLSVPFGGLMIPVAQTAEPAGVAVLSPTNTAPEGSVSTENAFQAAFGDNTQAAAMAEYALAQGHQTSVIVESPDDTYTLNTPRWFAEVFEAGGGQNIGSETFTIGQEDFGALTTRIAGMNPQPDVVYASMFMPDVGVFIKQMRQAGASSEILGADGYDTIELIEFAGEDAEGVTFTTHASPREGSRFAEFVEGVTEFQGRPPEAAALAALGADAILLVQAAVEQAGSTDPGAIREALAGLRDVPVVTVDAMTFEGTEGIPIKPVSIAAVEDGEFVFREEILPETVPDPST